MASRRRARSTFASNDDDDSNNTQVDATPTPLNSIRRDDGKRARIEVPRDSPPEVRESRKNGARLVRLLTCIQVTDFTSPSEQLSLDSAWR